jgi:hypothetical protein
VLFYHVGAVRKDSPIGELRAGRGSLLFTGGGFALDPELII